MEVNYYGENEYNQWYLLSKVNWRLCFREQELQSEFFEYGRYKKLSVVIGIVSFIGFILFVLNFGAIFSSKSALDCLVSVLLSTVSCLFTLNGCILCYSQFEHKSSLKTFIHKHLYALQVSFVCCVNLFIVFVTLHGFVDPNCSDYAVLLQTTFSGWHCNSSNIILYQLLTALSAKPLILLVALNDCRIDWILLGMLISNASVLGVAIYLHEIYFILFLILWTVVTGLVTVEVHLFRIGRFLAQKKLKLLLAENKRIQEENRATELRHMIGNLAHDLKTVSPIFFL